MQWEDKWQGMMSELGGDAKILDLWRTSSLLEICPKEVDEQMMMTLYDIGENYENLKAKVVSHTTNKTRQMRVPMAVDHVSGSVSEDQDWEDSDEVRTGSMCCTCGMMGHFARDCRRERQGQGKGGDGGEGYAKGKEKTVKSTGKKGSGTFTGSKGGHSGEQERLGTPRAVLDMQHRMSMESRLG